MDTALSSLLSQGALANQVGTAVARKGLDQQQIEGQNVLTLIATAAPSFTDPALGSRIDVSV